jgi:hypothetical protein
MLIRYGSRFLVWLAPESPFKASLVKLEGTAADSRKFFRFLRTIREISTFYSTKANSIVNIVIRLRSVAGIFYFALDNMELFTKLGFTGMNILRVKRIRYLRFAFVLP